MRIGIKIDGDLRRMMDDDLQKGARVVRSAVFESGEELKQKLRGVVTGAGLGSRLANAIRHQTYPRQDSLGAAAWVYARGGKRGQGGAAGILEAYESGATIRPKGGKYLVIPTADVPNGRGGRPMSIDDMRKRFKRSIRFIPRPGGGFYVVMTLSRNKKTGKFTRRKTKNAESVLLFVLVPQVQVKKRFSIDTMAEAAISQLADRVVQKWES